MKKKETKRLVIVLLHMTTAGWTEKSATTKEKKNFIIFYFFCQVNPELVDSSEAEERAQSHSQEQLPPVGKGLQPAAHERLRTLR